MIPSTMRCVEIPQYGPPEVLRLAQRPIPQPGPGEVLLRVAAAGLNRGDSVQRRGHYPPPPGASDLPGLEVSGIVEKLGDAVSGIEVGDAVCALLAGGGYAEYCTVAATHCLPVPANVSLVDAAGLPETAFTVWSTVWDQARLAPGETLLVHGGASGIGTAAIQMAAARGHRVFATAGGADRCAQCRALGAEVAIDYHSEDFVERVLQATNGKGVDVILDMVGGDYVERELKAMAESGRIVFIAFLRGTEGRIDIRTMMHKRISLIGSTLRSRSSDFKSAITVQLRSEIWPLIEAGKIRPVIDQVFDLRDAVQAHQRLDSGQQIGKILLRM
jgi:NADPH2:quinone reductase